ncbi:hypothetical protein LCGC14_1758640 [marine sediment metagenome]|uniref:Uncharacterized protein n=1 Tax=marine sediment metagenome TaxID=412755 RepID=A0A0F9K1B9_9ZZZZ
MSVPVILDFCASCGVLLPSGGGLEENPWCSNCAISTKNRGARIQGEFSEPEAARLLRINFGD